MIFSAVETHLIWYMAVADFMIVTITFIALHHQRHILDVCSLAIDDDLVAHLLYDDIL